MRSLLALTLIMLTACATAPSSETLANKSGALSARTLTPGECGLFVWTANPSKRFILFSQSQKMEAVWANGATEDSIVLSSHGGTPSEGQYPMQSFEVAGLKLSLKDPQAITQGTRYKAGTITQQSEEGWNKVTPVVGLSTCQTG